MNGNLSKLLGITIGTILVFAATIFLIDGLIPDTPLRSMQTRGDICVSPPPGLQQPLQRPGNVTPSKSDNLNISAVADEGL